jgi:hypothetical protein
MGRSRSIHVDVSSSIGDINRSYKWFAIDLLVEEISQDF